MSKVKIGDIEIGDDCPCYVIAEIGINYNGDLNIAKQSIAAAAEAGADAVKFQTFNADEFVADKNLKYTYETYDGKKITENQYDMFKRYELPDEWHKILQEESKKHEVEFLSSVADIHAVDLLDSLDVAAFKVASEDLINIDLLDYIANKNRLVILSTGMADAEEISNAVSIFEASNKENLVLLHCISAYPTPITSSNLNRIKALKNHYPFPIGYSDHTETNEASLLAIGMGVCIIEKHFTLDNTLDGPDHKFSKNPEQFKLFVSKIRKYEAMLGENNLSYATIEELGRKQFRRSIVAKKNIKCGEIISKDMLSYKRPGSGLKPYQRDLIIGKKANKNISQNIIVTFDDVK